MAFQLPATYTAPRRAAAIRYTSKGHLVMVRLPPSTSPSTTQWPLDTPEQVEDEDNDLSFVGSESEHSSDDEEDEESSNEDREELIDDEEREGSSDEDVGESSDDDGEDSDDEFSAEENFLLGEAKDLLKLNLPESLPMSLSNNLSFNEVFKIQEIDREIHLCRDLDAQGAQCKFSVSRYHSLSIKLVEKQLGTADGMKDYEIRSLAMYNLCDAHTQQYTKLAKEWIRLAKLTEAARKYWLNQQRSALGKSEASHKTYATFGAAEIRRILAQDKVVIRVEKEKTESQKTKIDNMESEVLSAEGLNESLKKSLTEYLDKISALEKQISNLATENSSLKEARESTENALTKERERDQHDLLDAQDLYKVSQRTVEGLHKEVDTLNLCIGKLTTKETSLKNSLESHQDALVKEKVRSRELEIRLEERVALGIKTQDSPETKLEKYLREELDKSQRHVLQQQKDFEKLRGEHVRLQITNATLESQVKQIESAKDELSRTSKEEFQEFAERNVDLSNQLHHAKAQFEQLKADLAAMEKVNQGEASKSKFSLKDIYKRPKREPSRLLTPPTDQ